MSALEKEVRQIVTEGRGNGEGRTLREQTQSINSDIATLLQLVEDQILRMRQTSSSSKGIVSEIRETIDSFERKERLIGRRPLLIEAESVDDEVSHVTLLQSEIYAEAETVMSKVDEQKQISDFLRTETQQAVDELETVKTRILVRIIDILRQFAYLTTVYVKLTYLTYL